MPGNLENSVVTTGLEKISFHSNSKERQCQRMFRFSWVHCSCSVVSNSLRPHGLQYARPPCPSPTPRVYSNSCPLTQRCHPTISSPVALFSCPQSFPTSGSFPMNRLFTSDGQTIGASASASVLPMNIQGWFPLGLTALISLLSKELFLDNNILQRRKQRHRVVN